MSYEHFYWFLDRKAANRVLRTAWKAFLERYPWDAQELRQLLEFAVEPSPKERALRSILGTKTLAWTVSRSVPALYLVHQVVHHVPALADRGGSVWFWDCHHFETLAINAVAARAFLDGRITARTLRAVFAIHGEYIFDLQFDVAAIDAKDLQRLSRAVHGKAAGKPLFTWLGERPAEEGYHWIREADTKLFLDFVREAWAGNWPALPLNPEVADELELKPRKAHKFRGFPVARHLAAAAKTLAGRGLSCVRYFELEVM